MMRMLDQVNQQVMSLEQKMANKDNAVKSPRNLPPLEPPKPKEPTKEEKARAEREAWKQ